MLLKTKSVIPWFTGFFLICSLSTWSYDEANSVNMILNSHSLILQGASVLEKNAALVFENNVDTDGKTSQIIPEPGRLSSIRIQARLHQNIRIFQEEKTLAIVKVADLFREQKILIHTSEEQKTASERKNEGKGVNSLLLALVGSVAESGPFGDEGFDNTGHFGGWPGGDDPFGSAPGRIPRTESIPLFNWLDLLQQRSAGLMYEHFVFLPTHKTGQNYLAPEISTTGIKRRNYDYLYTPFTPLRPVTLECFIVHSVTGSSFEQADLEQLNKLLQPVSSQWKTIGTLLGIAQDDLDQIQSDHRGAYNQLNEMISLWFKTMVPTAKSLISALMNLDEQSVADEVMQSYRLINLRRQVFPEITKKVTLRAHHRHQAETVSYQPPRSQSSSNTVAEATANTQAPQYHYIGSKGSTVLSNNGQGMQLTISDAFRAVLGKVTHWRLMAALLGVDSGIINNIAADNSDASSCLRETLEEWKKRAGFNHTVSYTWENLINVLFMMGLEADAWKLAERKGLTIVNKELRFDLSDKPSLKELVTLTLPVVNRWEELALNIGLGAGHLATINTNHSDIIDRMVSACQSLLSQENNKSELWQRIKTTLSLLGEEMEANKIKKS